MVVVAALVVTGFAVHGAVVSPGRSDIARGKALFDRHCVVCHGVEGRGDGLAAFLLHPAPRNFAQGRFRLVSTRNGVPTQRDLIAAIRNGMPGSAMPPWEWLAEEDLWSLALYVRQLSIEGQVSDLLQWAETEGDDMSAADARVLVEEKMVPGELIEAGPPAAMGAEAANDAMGDRRDMAVVAEGLALVDIGQMHLDHRHAGQPQGVMDGDRGVTVGSGIDDDPAGRRMRLLDPSDEFGLAVALARFDDEPESLGARRAARLELGQGLAAIDVGLPHPEQVQIGAVEDEDGLGHGCHVWSPPGDSKVYRGSLRMMEAKSKQGWVGGTRNPPTLQKRWVNC
jgi:mono/diheme cytochrome c family protein